MSIYEHEAVTWSGSAVSILCARYGISWGRVQRDDAD